MPDKSERPTAAELAHARSILGRAYASAGGKARAAALSPSRRKQIARKAWLASARARKKPKKPGTRVRSASRSPSRPTSA